MNKIQRLHDIDEELDKIIRNEKLSDYEKKLHITCMMIDLLNEIEEKEKEVKELKKEVSDAGWQREYDHRDDWRKVHEMGC